MRRTKQPRKTELSGSCRTWIRTRTNCSRVDIAEFATARRCFESHFSPVFAPVSVKYLSRE
jgi:hypothetical protein